MKSPVAIYDTTLRDGTQGEGFQLSVADKLAITELLDDLGATHVEGGWPGSNPRDEAYFAKAVRLPLSRARVVAFGATRRAGMRCDADTSIQALLSAGTPSVTIFGKAWRFQASRALGISPEENLELIDDTVRYLKARVDEVIFDAEHFFDGYRDNPAYALAALQAAAQAGADALVLCDTNGGTLTHEVSMAVAQVASTTSRPIGIHAHNDAELAVANSIAAVLAGASMVQGTINGYGERCGNANLVSVIPALSLKLGIECIPRDKLALLTRIAHAVDELTNQVPRNNQPYVGRSAFAHKGGVHVNAVMKDSRTYEHVDPQAVGNSRRVLVSDLSGKASVLLKAREHGIDLAPDDPMAAEVLRRVKELESEGYEFEGAEASFRLLISQAIGQRQRYFKLVRLNVSTHLADDSSTEAMQGGTATCELSLSVGGVEADAIARGNGPVHAMDRALRQVVDRFYPALASMRLVDYKVRALSSGDGTAAFIRVLVQSTDGKEVWGTVGVSTNVIAATWRAMVDAIEYKLMKDGMPSMNDATHPGKERVSERA
ncbi:MAG: citramalate synthase [Deltaproteobacteria bacterium]|nr:citramalate synthase [Deltaproteobacteria bacterium]